MKAMEYGIGYDAELRTPCSKEFKDNFRKTCRLLNGKTMAPVIRDLADGLIKAARKAQAWPACLENPNYRQVIQETIKMVLLEHNFNKENLN